MSLPEALSRIYLINLDRSADRLRQFSEANKHIEFARFAAVDGATLDRATLVESGYAKDDLPYGPGTLGCAMSHIRLWEIAAGENRSITVFEDDVVISRRFYDRASEIVAALPIDWDFIQWGYWLNKHRLSIWLDFKMTKVRIDGYGPWNWRTTAEQQAFQLSDFLVSSAKLVHSYGLFGYSISPRGATRALRHCLPLQKRLIKFEDGLNRNDAGIDVPLCSLYPEMNAYVCLPQLVIPLGQDESARKQIDVGATAKP